MTTMTTTTTTMTTMTTTINDDNDNNDDHDDQDDDDIFFRSPASWLWCALTEGGMAEEWRIGGMVEWQNGGNGGMAEWRKWRKWWEWRNDLQKYLRGNSIGTTNVAEWQKEWLNGRMVEWQDGYLPTTFMVHADNNDDNDDKDTF
jgi:hypothetical protein